MRRDVLATSSELRPRSVEARLMVGWDWIARPLPQYNLNNFKVDI
jgi:hypothetical protein